MKLLVAAALANYANAAYNMWHAIDDMMVICPVLPKPANLPAGMKWPTDKGYETTLAVTSGTSGIHPDKPHIVTFIRAGKTQAVDITYEVVDAKGVVVVAENTVSLEADGPAKNMAELCKCTGDNGRIGKVAEMTNKYGKNYGTACGLHDVDICNITYNTTGPLCCKQWCYVDKKCPDALLAYINYGAYYSFGGACPVAKNPEKTPCPYTAKPKADPCACKNVDKDPLWSAANITKFGAGYGGHCKGWDEYTCNDPNIYAPMLRDTWCCENWCWVDKTCKTALPSKIWLGLHWSTGECPDDPVKTSQCPFKSQVSQKAADKANPFCKCLGWTPESLKSTSGRRRMNKANDKPNDYGSTCNAWDKDKCDKYFPSQTHAIWCCQSWCYVDEDCPTSNPSMIAPGHFWSSLACKDHGPTLRDCNFSAVCKDDKAPTGLNNTIFPPLGAAAPAPNVPATYGKGCKAWDESICEGYWKTKTDVWGKAPYAAGAHDWCCQAWSYVHETCPGSKEGMAGLAYDYEICSDKMKDGSNGLTDNKRVWNTATKQCVTPAGGRRLGTRPLLQQPHGNSFGEEHKKTQEAEAHRDSETEEEQDDDLADPEDSLLEEEATDEAERSLSEEPDGDDDERDDDAESHDLQEADSDESDDAATAPLSHGRKLGRGGRRRASSSRRRSPPATSARRRQPTRASAPGRRRGPVGNTPVATSARRRAAPAGFTNPTPAPAGTPDAGRRRIGETGRRRANAASGASPAAPPDVSRRRQVGVAGRTFETGRRRGPAGAASTATDTGRRRIAYGYTSATALTSNYGGTQPKQSSYGFSGKGQKKGSTATIAMAAAAGVAGGAMLGVGGYYAYQRYKESKETGQKGTGYQSYQWCEVPSGSEKGKMIPCTDCIKKYGTACDNKDECFSGGGCNMKLPSDTLRDDILSAGFVPSTYTSPLKIKIKKINGTEFKESFVCPILNNQTTDSNQFIRASSFQTSLYVTLTEMNTLGAAEVCSADTHGSCSGNSGCGTNEICVGGWCRCKTGFCYNVTSESCFAARGTAGAPRIADVSFFPLLLAILCVLSLLKHH